MDNGFKCFSIDIGAKSILVAKGRDNYVEVIQNEASLRESDNLVLFIKNGRLFGESANMMVFIKSKVKKQFLKLPLQLHLLDAEPPEHRSE